MSTVSAAVDLSNWQNNDESRKCIGKMAVALRGHWQRPLGVSAPQVGHNLRIIAFKDLSNHGLVTVVANPEIKVTDKTYQKVKEGCLSVPFGLEQIHRRFSAIILDGFNCQDGGRFTTKYKGLTAAVIQHEIDHLDAIRWPANADYNPFCT